MGSVMDQERPWERDAKPEGTTLRDRIKNVLRDTNRLHETVEQIVCELERLKAALKPRAGAAEARITALEALLVEAERALEPFAECCEQIAADESDEEWAKFRLIVQNYRAASTALTKIKETRG